MIALAWAIILWLWLKDRAYYSISPDEQIAIFVGTVIIVVAQIYLSTRPHQPKF